MTPFGVTVSELEFVGQDLARPECVVPTANGDVFVSDGRGGITCLRADGGCGLNDRKTRLAFT